MENEELNKIYIDEKALSEYWFKLQQKLGLITSKDLYEDSKIAHDLNMPDGLGHYIQTFVGLKMTEWERRPHKLYRELKLSRQEFESKIHDTIFIVLYLKGNGNRFINDLLFKLWDLNCKRQENALKEIIYRNKGKGKGHSDSSFKRNSYMVHQLCRKQLFEGFNLEYTDVEKT